MTALREHLDQQGAYLCHSCPSDTGCTRCLHDGWDTLGERVQGCTGGSCKQGRRQCETPEACQVAERAEERADAGAYFLAVVILAVLSAVIYMHLWWL